MHTTKILTTAFITATPIAGATVTGEAAFTQPVIAHTMTTNMHAAAEDVAIRLTSKAGGRTWRGAIGDMITVSYLDRGSRESFTGALEAYREVSRNLATIKVAGANGEARTFIVADILGIESAGGSESTPGQSTETTEPSNEAEANNSETTTRASEPADGEHKWGFPTNPGPDFEFLPRIFLLPIQGGVGEGTRHDEMKKIGEIADQYGNGQIIVLKVDSPGGMVVEADLIHETLKDIKRRHRLIAWVEEAISAAAYTSLHCNEVYFMKTGTLGSATMFAGGTAIDGEQLRQWVKKFGDVAEESGHPRAMAEAMVTNSEVVSYDPADGDNDPVVYDTLEGLLQLSTNEENLTINAADALACGFADGIADNEAELAELLRLPFWYETTDDGRVIHERWQQTLKRAEVEIPKLFMRAQGQLGATNDQRRNLNTQLRAVEGLISWANTLGNHTGAANGLSLEQLEEWRKTLQFQIQQLN